MDRHDDKHHIFHTQALVDGNIRLVKISGSLAFQTGNPREGAVLGIDGAILINQGIEIRIIEVNHIGKILFQSGLILQILCSYNLGSRLKILGQILQAVLYLTAGLSRQLTQIKFTDVVDRGFRGLLRRVHKPAGGDSKHQQDDNDEDGDQSNRLSRMRKTALCR